MRFKIQMEIENEIGITDYISSVFQIVQFSYFIYGKY